MNYGSQICNLVTRFKLDDFAIVPTDIVGQPKLSEDRTSRLLDAAISSSLSGCGDIRRHHRRAA